MGLWDEIKRLFGGQPSRPSPSDWLRQQGRAQSPVPPPPPPLPRSRLTPLPPIPIPEARPAPRPSGLSGLDASKFAPMTGQDIRDAISDMGRPAWQRAFANGDWGRDHIPNAGVTRIGLIDRGMVAVGVITPEELVHIHEIGLQMDRARGDLRLAQRTAEDAVERSAAERAALKAKKKADAETRREEHRKAVAHRRQTDIIYLGRGVSRGLADRRANPEKLQAAGLPVLATPADVARALNLTIGRLRWLAFHSEASAVSHYCRFTVPKKSGGVRELAAPHRDMAAAQEWILVNILAKVPAGAPAHGFVKARSTVTNATPHAGKSVLINIDLKDFFPTVTFVRVAGIFEGMGYSPAAATLLGLISTESPRRRVEYSGKTCYAATGPRALPQGACTSPALSNLVARRMDKRLTGICAKLGWTYTRYADDMSFSGGDEQVPKVGYLLARVRHILQDEGFQLNAKKTRVLYPSAAQTVTGIVVNRRPAVRRRVARRVRAILHHAAREGLEAQNRHNHPHFESWLQGMIAYIGMVNPAQAEPLRKAWLSLP